MSNAAILFHPDAYDTAGPKLMGRQSAGESFLRGFLDHADVETLHLWAHGFRSRDDALALIRRNSDTQKPINWIEPRHLGGIQKVGCLYVPQPGNAPEAWRRQVLGSRAYSICGLTHTISSGGVMGILADMVTAPMEPWDALICTSRAARAAIEALLEGVSDYLAARLGATRRPPIQLPVIPLGIKASDFDPRPGARSQWRGRLAIPDDAVAALWVGRMSFHAKMNPAPMAMALQRAAQATGREVHWIFFGQAPSPYNETVFKQMIADHAPDVRAHYVDGKDLDARFTIWPAADLFFSLSDNIQETFGITPLEAMAAGVPSVVSDWDGYRDTVRDGVDGFRIPTRAPTPGMGTDLAFRFAQEWETYDQYIGAASLMTEVDIDAATAALIRLISDPELRIRMGRAAAEQARAVFDWKHIIPQYQALWGQLGQIRAHATSPTPPRGNPYRPDPFRMFGPYPTETLSNLHTVAPRPGLTPEDALELLRHPAVQYVGQGLPNPDQTRKLIELLVAGGPQPVAALTAHFPPVGRDLMARTLLIFAKYGLVTLGLPPA